MGIGSSLGRKDKVICTKEWRGTLEMIKSSVQFFQREKGVSDHTNLQLPVPILLSESNCDSAWAAPQFYFQSDGTCWQNSSFTLYLNIPGVWIIVGLGVQIVCNYKNWLTSACWILEAENETDSMTNFYPIQSKFNSQFVNSSLIIDS